MHRDVMKRIGFAFFVVLAVAAFTAVSFDSAQAHCASHCRGHAHWLRNQWGYGGWVRTYGLGGVADLPWVGGATTGVTPYGPYPYNHVNGL